MSAIKKEVVIGDCRLLLGDCLSIMPELGPVDAVVTDPPFGIKRDKGMGGGGKCFGGKRGVAVRIGRYEGDWDAGRPSPQAFEAMLALADDAIIWGGQFFADILPPQGKWLWWDKCQTMPSYGDGELAWTTLRGDAPKKFVYSNNGLMAKERGKVHPTQKPVALMEWCLGFLPGARTILDPFMGSGTTLVACAKRGLSGIGIEREESYFDIACRRVEEAYAQPDMFVEAPKPAAPTQEALL